MTLKRHAVLIVALAALLAPTSAQAIVERPSPLDVAAIDFLHQTAPPEPALSLAETRIRASAALAPFERQDEPLLSHALHQAYERLLPNEALGDEYRDSSNLFAFAAGDPVNHRDPTGLAASVGANGWIVATDNRNGGRIRRFSPEEIARDPMSVRSFLGRNADVLPGEADALIERAGQAWATSSDKMRVIAPGAAKAAGVYPLMAITAGAGIGGGVGAVAASAGGFGFVATTMVTGFTGGVGGQAGEDIYAGQFSGVKQYATVGATSAVVSLAVGSIFAGGQRAFGTPDVFPQIGTFAPPPPEPIFFGQRRAGPSLSNRTDVPEYLRGKPLQDIAAQLRSGQLSSDQIVIHVYRDSSGRLVSENTRGLTVLSMANMHPTRIEFITPSNKVLDRLAEMGVLGQSLPSNRIAITPSQGDESVLWVVRTPGSNW